ncbi:LysE family translocator [Pseudomonas syringae]|uniref:LysE family translocator n=1 Tax=Pseudomonas syringae TaxID=317 RepID=UPI00073EAE12|nr:LysE family translocator [Pseudomonas syringae]
MTLSLLLAFWAVSFLFVITPGVDWAYAISAGMKGRMVIPAVAGMLSGHLMATLLVAAGVGGLVLKIPMALTALTLMGSVYLMWLGLSMLLKPAVATEGREADESTWQSWALKGLCVSGLNPKVLLLFLALLPQFTSTESPWPIPLQIITLGLLHALSCGAVYLAVGFGARTVLASKPTAAIVLSRVSGASLVVIGVALVLERMSYF